MYKLPYWCSSDSQMLHGTWMLQSTLSDKSVVTEIFQFKGDEFRYTYSITDENAVKSKDKIVSIFNNIWGGRIHQLSIQYPEEYAAINKPLELKMSPEISERVKEVKNIASELQDSSFEDCLKSVQKWVRFAVNQHIEIYGDFA